MVKHRKTTKEEEGPRYLKMVALVAAEEALSQESLVTEVALEGQVSILGVNLLENQLMD